MKKRTHRLRNDDGSIAIEMASVLFFLSVLILGTFEVPRLLLIGQKLERASASMADLVSQIDPADGNVQAKINDLMTSVDSMMSPYDFGMEGRVIVSSIGNPTGNQETILWQRKNATGLDVTSSIGSQGGAPTLPGNLVVREGENIIAAEIVYHYTPLFGSIVYDEKTLYRSAFTRPRFTNLTSAPN